MNPYRRMVTLLLNERKLIRFNIRTWYERNLNITTRSTSLPFLHCFEMGKQNKCLVVKNTFKLFDFQFFLLNVFIKPCIVVAAKDKAVPAFVD
jgi:hypothetical protein